MRGWSAALRIALAIAVVDWIIKAVVIASVPRGGFEPLIPGRVAIWHVRNPAMILGLWENFPLGTRKVLAVVAAVVGGLALLQVVSRAHRLTGPGRPLAWLFVGMIGGGMLGNLGERLIHWGVTDYLSIRWGQYWLPPGNLADISLFLSVLLAIPVIGYELAGRARRGTTPPLQRPDASHPHPASGD